MALVLLCKNIFKSVHFYGILLIFVFIDNVCLQSSEDDVEKARASISSLKEVTGNPVDINEVQFFLHTTGPKGYITRNIDTFKPNVIREKDSKIYFLIHGWTQSRETTPWFKPLTEFLLDKNPDAYVIQTDWSKPANVNYSLSAFYTESVGNIIGDFIHIIVKDNSIPLKNIVLISHSLGAHVSGWAGKRHYELTHVKLPRIIALDPAGPLFSKRPDKMRLNKNDADVVMVIHTNGNGFGIATPSGTIDFFPNGGQHQQGCATNITKKRSYNADRSIWCDHTRAYKLFLEAVKNPKMFMAEKCKSYEHFEQLKCGRTKVSLGDMKTTKKGLFYLNTSGIPPFYSYR
ncbi:hypothetical protein WA026_018308 [Henosepilachna vigintioctopunctata]|uniref:Lipase domain-containing protein n=1 Tax=Henosepilachna vigintioctopunctata TaxID=420089 RepID=A0AAW1VBP1_9CUCU